MSTVRRLVIFGAIMLAVAMVLPGCGGGGGGGPLDIVSSGTLTTSDMVFGGGQYADLYSATATRDGYVVVEMVRGSGYSVYDPEVRVVNHKCTSASAYNSSYSDHGYLAFNDDRGDGTLNSLAYFEATKGQQFTVAFTTHDAGDTGSYVFAIYEVDSTTAFRSPSNPGQADKKPRPEGNDAMLTEK